jgi:hypothetical protein
MPTRDEIIAELKRRDTIKALKDWDERPENYDNLNPDVAETKPYKFDPVLTAANVVPSLANLAWDTTYPARHPLITGQSFLDLSSGLLEKMGVKAETKDSKTVDAVAGYLGERYGSVESAMKSFQEDPAGVLSDVTSIIHGGGSILNKVGVKGAGVVADIAKAVDPINAMMNTGKAGFKMAADATDPVGRLESAAKFSTVLDDKFGVGERRRLAEVLLRNKIGLNYEGTVDLENMIKGLNGQIDAILDSSQGRAANIPAAPTVTRHIPKLRQDYGSVTQANPYKNVKVIDNVVDTWRNQLNDRGNAPWDLQKLQQFKKNMYNQADYNVNPTVKASIQNDTYKALGRAAKEGIEDRVPQIGKLNSNLSDLYSLRPALIRSSGRIGNRDLSGIGTPIKTVGMSEIGQAIGGDVGSSLGAAYGFASGMADTPLIKAKIAQKLFNAQQLSLGDIYKSSGTLPTVLRNISTQTGQGALLLNDDELVNPDETWDSLLSIFPTKR